MGQTERKKSGEMDGTTATGLFYTETAVRQALGGERGQKGESCWRRGGDLPCGEGGKADP